MSDAKDPPNGMTQMGVRAAVAAVVAIALTRLVSLERPYWVLLTAVLLVNETWGESIRKAAQRLGMTILGCLFGWLLYDLVASHPAVWPVFLLLGAGVAVYFRTGWPAGSYALMTFWLSVYVVFLFAVMGVWTRSLVLTRIADTAIGCVVAVAVSAVVFPKRSGHQLSSELADYWTACRDSFARECDTLLSSDARAGLASLDNDLPRLVEKLRASYRSTVYEKRISGDFSAGDAAMLSRSERLCPYLLAFATASADPVAQRIARAVPCRLRTAVDWIRWKLDMLAGQDDRPAPETPPRRLMLSSKEFADQLTAEKWTEVDLLSFATVIGCLEGMLGVLLEDEAPAA